MPENKKCQFKSRWRPDYTCPEPPLEDSEKGYCIFHEPREDKDIKKFQEGIKKKISKEDYDFTGYWFPEHTTTFLSRHHNFNFKNYASFQEATFRGEAEFVGSTFEKEAFFMDCTFEGKVFFRGATFKRGADFRGRTKFEGIADFTEATFEKKIAWFTGATFEGNAQFEKTTFEQGADFRQARFKSFAYFEELKIKGLLYLDNETKFEEPKGADVPFRIGRLLWHRQGNYVEEGKYHYQEMDYIRKQKNWFVRYILANLFHRLLYGYGEKPVWIFGWCGGLIIFSSLIYWISKGVLKIVGVQAVPVEDYWNSLYFSVVTFTTLGYGDFRPIGKIKILASIEAILGIFFVALFIFTFARKTAER